MTEKKDLERIAAELVDMSAAVDSAAGLVDGTHEGIVAALLQVALARRMMERALADSGEVFDRLAEAVADAGSD